MTTMAVIKALRCTATAGVHGNCDGCPYWIQEELPRELWEEFGATYTEGCDIDRVALDAADLLETLDPQVKEGQHEQTNSSADTRHQG